MMKRDERSRVKCIIGKERKYLKTAKFCRDRAVGRYNILMAKTILKKAHCSDQLRRISVVPSVLPQAARRIARVYENT